MAELPLRVCWCCALWGIAAEGTTQPNDMEPGWMCESCANATPEECNLRHLRQADDAAVQVQPRRRARTQLKVV